MRGEEIELWLDVNNYNSSYNRERTKAKADENTRNRFTNAENEKAKADVEFKEGVTTGLYKFGISLGDFVNKEPTMTMNSTDELTSVQKVAALNLNVVADLTEKGYYLMFKIPFSALGKTGAPISENENEIIEWGCTIRVIDIDNEFRPERFTILQTSLFNEESPVSYGSLLFMPDETWYGETYNIYRDKIVQSIEEFGY
jgi:hypothetical protein